MAKIPATEFKARCLELMDRVAEQRTSYVITKRGKPVAQLVPVARTTAEPLLGRLRHMAQEVGDIVASVVPPSAWRTIEKYDGLERSENRPRSDVKLRKRSPRRA